MCENKVQGIYTQALLDNQMVQTLDIYIYIDIIVVITLLCTILNTTQKHIGIVKTAILFVSASNNSCTLTQQFAG